MKFEMTDERLAVLRRKGAMFEADTNCVVTSTAREIYIDCRWEDMGPENVLEEIAGMCCYEPELEDEPDYVFDGFNLTDEEKAFIKSIPPSGLPQTRVKWKWKKLGGHVHVRCFSCTTPGETWALNGTLVFDEGEWDRLVSNSGSSAYVIIQEEE